MNNYSYVAHDATTGKKVHSTIRAESERAAAKLLSSQSLVPISIKLQDDRSDLFHRLTNRVSSKDRVMFARQLATLINAGLPLTQSLRTVAEQTQSKRLREVIGSIIRDVEGGKSLADSFAVYPDIFSGVFVAMIAAGETSGTLDVALDRIASQQEKDAEVIAKVRGAMVYPIIVLVVIVAVIIFMMATVVPQIEQLYKDLGQSLPFVTMVLVAVSRFMAQFWWLVIMIMIAVVYFSKRYIETDTGRKQFDGFKLHAPLFGGLLRKLYMARFTRTGETLLATGVQMLESLKICARAVNNVVVAQDIKLASEEVKGGKALSVALKNKDSILPLVSQMIGIGEQSGAIDRMMDKTATYYENEIDNEIKAISTIIEPALMVMMAVMAGIMVVAILLPIYGLVGSGAIR